MNSYEFLDLFGIILSDYIYQQMEADGCSGSFEGFFLFAFFLNPYKNGLWKCMCHYYKSLFPSLFSLEKLVSLLPEYVVPYMIHLLAHDPDFTKPHEYEQLKDIKE